MKKTLALALLAAFVAAPAFAEAVKGEWTGYITDTHCGAKGANAKHTAACVEKCVKGGSKAQIMNEADQAIYDLDGLDKVKALVGSRVTLKGTLDTEKKTIAVESAAKTESE